MASSPSASSQASADGRVVPARLGFLAIFNPSLGTTDEAMDEQIVYYASVSTQQAASTRRGGRPTDALSAEERHERLRQIGLAQGMTSFSRGFADGAAVDAIDTERSRVLVYELEPGWWILARIDLTKVPLPPRLPTKTGQTQEQAFEHSSRELKPTSLLLGDLVRAHTIFLMHHGSSLSGLFVHSRRSKFVALLSRYWDLFLSTWNVMLHGSPAREMWGGINIAASGELGVGVGEEERGSGEREVLEGLVGRIEGLVDLVVSKFASDDETAMDEARGDAGRQRQAWLGTGQEPAAEDGAIFLGTGALSRKSLRDVTHWMEDLYTWGEHAYGVIESPTSIRRAKGADGAAETEQAASPSGGGGGGMTAAQGSHASSTDGDKGASKDGKDGRLDKMLGYIKLGYGSYWTLAGSTAGSTPPAQERRPAGPKDGTAHEAAGHYLIGLQGRMEESASADVPASGGLGGPEAEHNSRTVVRTVHVELESCGRGERPEATVVKDLGNAAGVLTQAQGAGNALPAYNSHDRNKAHKLRVVVYVNRPFIFAFFFGLHTDSLVWESLYRSLHYQLAPLKKPLLASTRYRPRSSRPPTADGGSGSTYSLVWDPSSLTLHCSVPSIPAAVASGAWTRADGVSTHLQLLHMHAATRPLDGALERTHKTSRGWWLAWTRLVGWQPRRDDGDDASSAPAAAARDREADEDPRATAKEIFLVHRASDHAGLRGLTGGDPDGGLEAGSLARGIGVDTRRYIEELLSLL